jgi:hypothetical protein
MRCSQFVRLCLLPGLFCLVAAADSISPVYVSLGPNPFGSPSYAAYTSNAQTAVTGGGGNIGHINSSPTAFNTITSASIPDMLVDGNFASWRGTANPASPFDNELGTVAFFSVVITGNGNNNLSLSQITFTQGDTDLVAPNYFGNPLYGGTPAGSYASSSYSADHVGVLADGTLVTSGAATQMVNKIILTSFSAAFDASFYPDNGQQQIDDAIADLNTLGDFTLNVCFQDASAGLNSCGSLNVAQAAAVPEPGTFAFLALALVALTPAFRKVSPKEPRA